MARIEHSLLESANRITGDRNRQTLVNNLIKELRATVVNIEDVILLHVPPGANFEYLEVGVSSPVSAFSTHFKLVLQEHRSTYASTNRHVQQAIEKRIAVLIPADGQVKVEALFPIVINKAVISVLCIYSNKLDKESINVIKLLTSIYSNFLTAIDDGERDSLTQLLNRKTFDLQLAHLLSESKGNPSPRMSKERRTEKEEASHWVAILDIDHFKSINDNYGHMYGDEVLLLFSSLMRDSFRHSDLLFRYGGEEFVVVLAPTTEDNALMIFDRFRSKLANFSFPQVDRVTASIGMLKMCPEHHTTTLLDHADKALYYAKENGRNQVCDYTQLITENLLEEVDVLNDVEMF